MRCIAPVALGLAVLLAGCLPVSKKARAPGRLFQCRRARGTITVDGKLDEAAGGNAQYLDDFRVPPDGGKPATAAAARLLWDDQHLYFAAVIEDKDVYAVHKTHDANTWEDDVVELFVKPSDHTHHYYEIHVNPLNTTLDLLIPRRGAGSFGRFTPWESHIRSAVVIEGSLNDWHDADKGWIVEAAIPLEAFGKDTPKPQLGDRWRFAVCRYDYSVYLDDKQLSSTARLSAANFHLHEDFDWLEFAE